MKAKNSILLIIGLLAVGLATGMLMAPDEGSKTRKKLKKKAKKYQDKITQKAKDLKDKGESFMDNVEGAAKDVKKRFA